MDTAATSGDNNVLATFIRKSRRGGVSGTLHLVVPELLAGFFVESAKASIQRGSYEYHTARSHDGSTNVECTRGRIALVLKGLVSSSRDRPLEIAGVHIDGV